MGVPVVLVRGVNARPPKMRRRSRERVVFPEAVGPEMEIMKVDIAVVVIPISYLEGRLGEVIYLEAIAFWGNFVLVT